MTGIVSIYRVGLGRTRNSVFLFIYSLYYAAFQLIKFIVTYPMVRMVERGL